MRRKTFRQLRAKTEAQFHHHVYVVLLDAAAAKDRKVRAANPQRDPKKPCLYVGMTGLRPEERFWNHKNGEKAARVVTRFGLRLLPELFAHLNPMPLRGRRPDGERTGGRFARARLHGDRWDLMGHRPSVTTPA